MRLERLRKKASSTDYVIKWIISIAIIVAAGFAIRNIFSGYFS